MTSLDADGEEIGATCVNFDNVKVISRGICPLTVVLQTTSLEGNYT